MKKIALVILMFASIANAKHPSIAKFEDQCEKGYTNACLNLGLSYNGGVGVQADKSKALKYFKKACDDGLKPGCDWYKKLSK